jgi:MOSC domain-containing protein YiiM
VNDTPPDSLRLLPLAPGVGAMTVADAAGTVRSAPARWRWTLEGIDELPPAAEFALDALARSLSAAGGSGPTIDALADDVAASLAAVGAGRPARPLLEALDPADPLVAAVESVDRELSAAARAVVAQVAVDARGRVASLNVSGGGVPKHSVSVVEIGPAGCVGDRQRVRRHHGRPHQAVSIWSLEVVEALAAAGHPIGPGAAGENLTLSELDWSSLRPGIRIVVGAADAPAVLEVTGWADPCSTIAGCFSDGVFQRIAHDRHPGTSRAYAAVVRPGRVSAGDPVVLMA